MQNKHFHFNFEDGLQNKKDAVSRKRIFSWKWLGSIYLKYGSAKFTDFDLLVRKWLKRSSSKYTKIFCRIFNSQFRVNRQTFSGFFRKLLFSIYLWIFSEFESKHYANFIRRKRHEHLFSIKMTAPGRTWNRKWETEYL